jgi:hypothetical protein
MWKTNTDFIWRDFFNTTTDKNTIGKILWKEKDFYRMKKFKEGKPDPGESRWVQESLDPEPDPMGSNHRIH